MLAPARIASVLASIAAVLAAVAAATGIPVVADARSETVVVEAWRVVGLVTSAALLVLLALRPTRVPALWLVLLASKASLVVVGLTLGSQTPGAADLVLWDGVLVVILAAGYVAAALARRREREPRTGA